MYGNCSDLGVWVSRRGHTDGLNVVPLSHLRHPRDSAALAVPLNTQEQREMIGRSGDLPRIIPCRKGWSSPRDASPADLPRYADDLTASLTGPVLMITGR